MRKAAGHKVQETMECLEPLYRLDSDRIPRRGSALAATDKWQTDFRFPSC